MQTAFASEPARKIVSAITVLQTDTAFPLALLPHLILFFAGNKPALRLVLRNDIAASFQQCAHDLAYHCADAPIAITQVGDQWGQIDRTASGVAAPTTHRVLVMSADRKFSEHTLDLELYGESSEVGRILGYPECCVDAYPSLAQEAQRWPDALMARSHEPLTVSMWCNRLASLWGGTCSTGELFPCSLQCANAIRYGQQADTLLREHGFDLLAEEIRRQGSRSLYLLDGEVVAGKPTSADAREISILV